MLMTLAKGASISGIIVAPLPQFKGFGCLRVLGQAVWGQVGTLVSRSPFTAPHYLRCLHLGAAPQKSTAQLGDWGPPYRGGQKCRNGPPRHADAG